MELWQVWTAISAVSTAWRSYVTHYPFEGHHSNTVIQLYLSLVEIGNLYLNFGRVWYIICQRRKESRYYLFNISKSRVLDYSIILLADSTFSKGMAVSLRLAAY